MRLLIGSQLVLHFLLLSYHQHFRPRSSWFVSDSVIVSVFQNRWNPRNLRLQSRAVLQDSLLLKLSLKRSTHRSLTLHIIRAPHRNVCLGCVSLSLAASFLRPSVTPCCFVPDSAFLFSHLVPLYACTATFRFLVCTFQHFEKLNMSLPVASDN